MRKITGLLLALIVGGTIGLGVTTYYKPGMKQLLLSKTSQTQTPLVDNQDDDFKKAQSLLTLSKPQEAALVISKYTSEIDNQTEQGKKWLALLVQASTDSQDIPQLMHIYEFDPSAIEKNENASILVSEQLIAAGNLQGFHQLKEYWKSKSTIPEKWFILDADALILERKTTEAVDLLQSKSFEGKEDTPRLVRLSLLHMNDQPKAAWNYLIEAQKKNPNSTDVRTYRARFLESVGKPQLALVEYIAASSSDPANPFLKDQIADFYIRSKKYDQALKIWSESLNPPTGDSIWLKAIFWNKLVAPINFNWIGNAIPEGVSAPLINYLLGLAPGQFWDQKKIEHTPDLQSYLKNEQITFWLRLLENLKNGEEEQAAVLIQYNPFAGNVWEPDLLKALQRILNYRKTGNLVLPSEVGNPTKVAQVPDIADNAFNGNFINQINQLGRKGIENPTASIKVPEDLHELIMSPEVFSAALISANWREAGLQLHKIRIIPPTFPQWVTYNLTQALRTNRGVVDALKFATLQKKNPSLSLLIAELMMIGGSPDAGMSELQKLTGEPGQVGYRASWLLSLIYMEKKQFNEAKAVIEANPKLAQDQMGQEALARISLLQGDNDSAEKIYSALEQQSTEAKSFLARKAFQDKNWEKAQTLTEDLLKVYPTNQVLKDNLQKIKSERGQKTP